MEDGERSNQHLVLGSFDSLTQLERLQQRLAELRPIHLVHPSVAPELADRFWNLVFSPEHASTELSITAGFDSRAEFDAFVQAIHVPSARTGLRLRVSFDEELIGSCAARTTARLLQALSHWSDLRSLHLEVFSKIFQELLAGPHSDVTTQSIHATPPPRFEKLEQLVVECSDILFPVAYFVGLHANSPLLETIFFNGVDVPVTRASTKAAKRV